MRSEGYIICLCYCRYLLKLHYTSRVGNIGLDVVTSSSSEQLVIVKASIKSLARGYSDGGLLSYGLECFKIVGRYGLFKEHGLEGRDLLGYLNSRRNVKASVSLDKQVYLISNRVANCGDTADSLIQVLIGNLQVVLAKRVPLHGGHSALDSLCRLFSEFLGLFCSREPAVDVYAAILVHLSAEKLINGHSERFSEDIPQSHFHG